VREYASLDLALDHYFTTLDKVTPPRSLPDLLFCACGLKPQHRFGGACGLKWPDAACCILFFFHEASFVFGGRISRAPCSERGQQLN